MRDSNILDSLLNFWEDQNTYKTPFADNSDSIQSPTHFSDIELYKLSLTGAIEQASEKDIYHLNNCSDCFARWNNWRNAVYFSTEKSNKPDLSLCYGRLEAAATKNSSKEPVSSRSNCGRFLLSLYPQENSCDIFMITIETLAENGSDYEGDNFQVRDANNQVLLDGIMHNRRLARLKKGLQQPDLTTWTVTKTTPNRLS